MDKPFNYRQDSNDSENHKNNLEGWVEDYKQLEKGKLPFFRPIDFYKNSVDLFKAIAFPEIGIFNFKNKVKISNFLAHLKFHH